MFNYLGGQVPSAVQPQEPIEEDGQEISHDTGLPNTPPTVLAPIPNTIMPSVTSVPVPAPVLPVPISAPVVPAPISVPVIPVPVPAPVDPVPVPAPVIPVPAPAVLVPIPAPVDVLQPAVLPAAPALPPPLPQPGNVWLAATNLIVGENGQLQQSAQSPEISKYISKIVRSASSKILFIDAFPGPEKQYDWLTQSLASVLQDQAKTDRVAYEVNLRAQGDQQYLLALISMVCCWLALRPIRFLSQLRQQVDGPTPDSLQSTMQGHQSLRKSARMGSRG